MFNREFFVEQLPRLRQQFSQEVGHDPQVELLLAHGLVFRTDQEIDAGADYVTVTYILRQEKRRAVFPYGSIVAVNLTPNEQRQRKPAGLAP